MSQVLHIGRALIAILLSWMMVLACPCEPCGVGGLLQSAEAAAPSDSPFAATGCCPGDEGDEEDQGEHACPHCDVDAALQAGQDTLTSDLLAPPNPTPLPQRSSATHNTGTTWRPIVQPVVVRRANGPPPLHIALPTSVRLAQLSILRC